MSTQPQQPQTTAIQRPPVHVGERGVELRSLDDFWTFAKWVAASGLAPAGFKGPEQIVIAIELGMNLGLAPLQALSTIAVINNRPCLWGDGFKAVIEASPACEYVKEWWEGTGETLTAWCETKRRNRPEPTRYPFSIADAKRAGLFGKSGPWQQYLPRMLQMRARGFCLRDAYPDVLKGIALAEEVLDFEVRNVDAATLDSRPLQRPQARQLSDVPPPHESDIPFGQPQQHGEAPGALAGEPPAPESATSPEAAPVGTHDSGGARTESKRVSEAQLKRFHAIVRECGWSKEDASMLLSERYGLMSSRDIRVDQYDEIVAHIQANKATGATA